MHKIEGPGDPVLLRVSPGEPHPFDLTAAMALIVGSMLGVGISPPTSLAAHVLITLVPMALPR